LNSNEIPQRRSWNLSSEKWAAWSEYFYIIKITKIKIKKPAAFLPFDLTVLFIKIKQWSQKLIELFVVKLFKICKYKQAEWTHHFCPKLDWTEKMDECPNAPHQPNKIKNSSAKCFIYINFRIWKIKYTHFW
jgi:hypothetical protein